MRIVDTFRSSLACVLRVTALVWITTAGSTVSAQQSTPAHAQDMDVLRARGGLASLPSPMWVQKRPIPVAVHFASQSDLTRTDPPYNEGHIRTRETPSGDPGVAFKVGDAILTGTEKESWPITRASFERTYAPAGGSRMGRDGKFVKKPAPVLGVQMREPFAVTASWGRLEGTPGDWLVQYDDEGKDFGVVGQDIFEQTYERLTMTPDLRAKLDAMRARVPKG
jgi:PGDYG protein